MSPKTSSSPKPATGKFYILLAVLLLVAFGAFALLRPDNTTTQSNEYFEVTRGDFLISIVEAGELKAVNEIAVRNSVEGTARIIYIVPEGSYVKKGDMLVELDSAEAEDAVNQQQIAYEKAQYDLIAAQEQLAIQRSQAESDIKAAETALTIAQIDLDKFKKGLVVQNRRELELEVENIKENLAVNEETLKWSEELYAQGFETKSTLDKHKLAVSGSLMNLAQATNALWMWEQFDYNKQLTEFQSIVDEAKRELERVKHQAKSKLAQFEAEVATQESTLDLQKRKLERDQRNLTHTKIYAPADGLVVYHMQEGRFSNESMIEEGATVRNRQQLIKLPDTSKMKLSIKVHETHVSKIRAGQPAYVVLDPLPDKRFRGVVSKVGLLPDGQRRWGNPDIKVYDTEILIIDALPEDVKPGVSAHAEVIITNLQNVLTVPVQSVTSLQGKPIVYQAGNPPVATSVEVGLFNTKFIEVVSGLNVGDRVLLSPPLEMDNSNLSDEIMSEGEEVPQTPPDVLSQIQQNESRQGRGPAGFGNGTAAPRGDGAGFGAGDGESAGAPNREGRRRGGAGEGEFDREAMMKQFDTNGDGEIDEQERAAIRQRFEQMRQNGGGSGGFGGPGGRSGDESTPNP